MTQDERFYKSLYDEANEHLKEVYKQQKDNRDELLQVIAMIILNYTVLDGVMSLRSNDKAKEYKRLSKLIKSNMKGVRRLEKGVINNILTNTVKNTFNFYSYNANLKDVKGIVDKNFKGKHFSTRVWENEQQVANHLHRKVKQFLDGKVNVNQIKKDIGKTFNTNAYNAKRLAETEVSRCSNNAFDRFCKETGVKKVRYNATLDSRTCPKCSPYDGKPFDFDEKIELPQHALCRCFYTIEDDETASVKINLQLFAKRIVDKDNVLEKIDIGVIDGKSFYRCKYIFDDMFKNGINTPIGIVKNKQDRFYHISNGHFKDFKTEKGVKRIKETLENPEVIRKAIDKRGRVANGYIKKYEGKLLLVIVKNDIITSYYPSKNYIRKNVEGWEVIWQQT